MSLNLDNLLTVPEEHAANLPCVRNSYLFTDPALDVDSDDDEYLNLTSEQQHARIANKQAAEKAAAAACQACPILNQCKEWALSTRVFGVAGGLTDSQRAEIKGIKPVEVVVDITQRGPRGNVRDDLIDRWTQQGLTAAEIATRLNCAKRTVERRRLTIAEHGIAYGAENPAPLPDTTSHTTDAGTTVVTPTTAANATVRKATAAKRNINLATVSEETLAMYTALADGATRDRDEIITAALPYVDDETAAKWGKNAKGNDAQKIAAGRRKFLMNRLDIAVRRNRITSTKLDSGRVVLTLATDVREAISEMVNA